MAHEVTLGKLIEGDKQRDAVHIAIAPVIAAEILAPGQDIGLTGDKTGYVSRAGKHIGIVDP